LSTDSVGSIFISSATVFFASSCFPLSHCAIAIARNVDVCMRFERSERWASSMARSYLPAPSAAVEASES